MATAKVSPTTDEFEPTNNNGRDHDTEPTGNWFTRDQVNSESNKRLWPWCSLHHWYRSFCLWWHCVEKPAPENQVHQELEVNKVDNL